MVKPANLRESFSGMPSYHELHRHLGGAIVPRVFWRYLIRHGHPLSTRFPRYEQFERFVTRPRDSLTKSEAKRS